MTRSDLDDILRRSNRSPDGTYRAVAARRLSGRVIGPFKYFGTRNDDPNDIVPHEDRRELRALKVFGAWTNLTDMKAGNTLDTVVTENGRGVVRHYLQDVGSTFGTGALDVLGWADGWNYFYDGGVLVKRLVSLGFYLEPWQTASYTGVSLGRPFRRRLIRSARVETARADGRIPPRPGRRHVLGSAASRRVQRRSHSRDCRDWRVQ